MTIHAVAAPPTRWRRAPRPRDPYAPPPLLVIAWAALVVNVLGWAGTVSLLPLPHIVGQLISQGSLGIAFFAALCASRSMPLRPHPFIVLLLAMAVVSVMVSLHSPHLIGSTYRSVRFLGFVVVLWLLTPWFGRHDLMILRCHIWVVRAILATVVLGTLVAPGKAMSWQGRLSAIVFPMPPTQVAHYSAVLLGTTIVLWFNRVVRGRTVVITVLVATPILVMTHTRTALFACLLGLGVAGASIFIQSSRVRRIALGATCAIVVAVVVFSSELVVWLLRGQTAESVGNLTGRTVVWNQIGAMHRDTLATLFGSGASNMSFNGLPIDSSWMSTYVDQGWYGVTLQAAALATLLVLALSHGSTLRRSVALFLLIYCGLSSITESGLGGPSPYLLDVTVALSLIMAPPYRRFA